MASRLPVPSLRTLVPGCEASNCRASTSIYALRLSAWKIVSAGSAVCARAPLGANINTHIATAISQAIVVRSERDSRGEDPRVVVAGEPADRDLEARARRESNAFVDRQASDDESGGEEYFVLARVVAVGE